MSPTLLLEPFPTFLKDVRLCRLLISKFSLRSCPPVFEARVVLGHEQAEPSHPVTVKNGDGAWKCHPRGEKMPLLQVLGVTPRLLCPQCTGQVLQGNYGGCSLFYRSVSPVMEAQLAPELGSFNFLVFQSYRVVPCRYLLDAETAPHFWKPSQIQNSNSTFQLLKSLSFPSLLRNKFVPLQLYPSYPFPIHFVPMLNPRSLTEEVKHKSSHQWWWSVPKAWFSELNSSIQGTEAFNKTCGPIF